MCVIYTFTNKSISIIDIESRKGAIKHGLWSYPAKNLISSHHDTFSNEKKNRKKNIMSVKRPQYPPLSTFECVMRKMWQMNRCLMSLNGKRKRDLDYEAKMKMAWKSMSNERKKLWEFDWVRKLLLKVISAFLSLILSDI